MEAIIGLLVCALFVFAILTLFFISTLDDNGYFRKDTKQGLINGTYHLQLSKEELLAHRKAVSIALPILRVTEPEEIYKDIVETLENMAPKFTP